MWLFTDFFMCTHWLCLQICKNKKSTNFIMHFVCMCLHKFSNFSTYNHVWDKEFYHNNPCIFKKRPISRPDVILVVFSCRAVDWPVSVPSVVPSPHPDVFPALSVPASSSSPPSPPSPSVFKEVSNSALGYIWSVQINQITPFPFNSPVHSLDISRYL